MTAPQTICLPGQADLFALHLDDPEAYPFLLESRQHGPQTGRYSLLFTECDRSSTLRCCAPQEADDFFARLPRKPGRQDNPHQLPFIGGWFCYFAYEFAAALLPHVQAQPSTGEEAPLALAVYCGGAIIVDHRQNRTWILSEQQRCQDHQRALQRVRIQAGPPEIVLRFNAEHEQDYLNQVRKAVEYIQAGDIYQANLSRRWHACRAIDSEELLGAYAQLRRDNPASFAASVQHPDLKLASASPERLVVLDQGRIETRPIAGTRPRGRDAAEDTRLLAELLGNAKEQAEHIMLVDLERNDLGRICQAGSVEVNELLGIESYATVHHIVSNVRGQLRAEVELREVLAAVFPGGTITGCPKIRCMQIIAELEARQRGAYTGSLGYLSNSGRLDLNILIRTLVLQGQHAFFDAGAGIVADSVADRELAETQAKARGLMRALGGCR